MTQEIELEALIQEQKQDMLYGNRCWPEFSGMLSLDRLAEEHIEINQDGKIEYRWREEIRSQQKRTGSRRNARHGTRCTKHKGEGRRSPQGKAYCNGCRREYMRKRLRPVVKRTHCINGHPVAPENTRVHHKGGNRCLVCARERYARRPLTAIQKKRKRDRQRQHRLRVERKMDGTMS